jgi:SsrA-binding protein
VKKSGTKNIATNRKATHDYFLDDSFEAGIALQGTEIKSLRAGRVSLREAYVQIEKMEAWLLNVHIAPYDPASRFNHDPKRPRKLLLHKREIRKLNEQLRQRGYTIIPTRMYFKSGRVKVEIALARGKRKYDKRRTIAKRDAQREIDRSMSKRNRSR